MFSFICGEIVSADNYQIVLKSGDIGYEIAVSEYTAYACQEVGSFAQLFTYLQVKEDGLTLFGFATTEEKKMFLQLITVSGIGCKMALSVLSNCSLNDLAIAIYQGNIAKLSSVKGIGKKTAERLILELKDKIAPPLSIEPAQKVLAKVENRSESDAVSALVTLGVSQNEAVKKVNTAVENGFKTTEDILNFALRNLR